MKETEKLNITKSRELFEVILLTENTPSFLNQAKVAV